MLKIRDDVNLKELEKFGFKPKYDENTGKIRAYEKIKKRTRIYRIVRNNRNNKKQNKNF